MSALFVVLQNESRELYGSICDSVVVKWESASGYWR